MSSIAQWLKQVRLPHICALCNHHHDGHLAICLQCHEFLTPIVSACTYCARPLPKSNFMTCGKCIKTKPYFDQTIAPYSFEEPLRTLLHDFKYRHSLYLVSFLAQLILANLPTSTSQPECLIPVPMHPERLRRRGFNQAAELAKFIGRVLSIPCKMHICQKILHTSPQAGLNASQRQKNLHNAFHTKPVRYKRVALIDDLLTTGNTANEIAKTLKRQGVEHVSIWCCARTIDERSLD